MTLPKRHSVKALTTIRQAMAKGGSMVAAAACAPEKEGHSPGRKTPLGPIKHQTGFIAAAAPVYFEIFAPPHEPELGTVVMIHGGAHSGNCYQRTADGRPGWAYLFAERGYRVVVPDWPGIGRSGHVPSEQLNGDCAVRGLAALIESLDTPVVLLTHSMSGCYGWRLLELSGERISTIVGVAPSPPGNIQPTPKIHAETAEAFELEVFGEITRIEKTRPFIATRAFIEDKLVGKSSQFPRERLPEYAASLLATPPQILIERLNIGGRQLRVSDPSCFAGKPIFVITGTHDLDHSRATDAAIVTWLNAHGAKAEFCFLGDRGIVGNGHMLMLEQNSDDIAAVILDWLDRIRIDPRKGDPPAT
jgi:pimeloyl-ACP methyl ester carboxylesterase